MPIAVSTIQDVLDKLDAIIRQAEQSGSRQGYFAALYRRMTLAVQQASDKNDFTDKARMERLDVTFAKRYLDSYEAYQDKSAISHSWQFVFDTCEQKNITVIQHLLLGINTHINLDLAIAAADTCPGEAIYELRADYDLINDTIASLLDEVQDKLTKVWWPLFFIRKIVNHRQDGVINFSISTARTAAWANAVALCNAAPETRSNYIHGIDETVVAIANGITKPGWFAGLILKAVRWSEYKEVKRVIRLLNAP